MNAMGFAGFSISKFSTMEINNELIFLEFRYCCNSAWTSAAWKISQNTLEFSTNRFQIICGKLT